MKRTLTLLLAFCAALTGCNSTTSSTPPDSGKLTTEKAQRAMDTWIRSVRGTARVQGVQEITQNNAAIADVKFTDLPAKDGFQRDVLFSGMGKASFTHYSDGRWVLKRVDIMHQNQTTSSWSDITIEVR